MKLIKDLLTINPISSDTTVVAEGKKDLNRLIEKWMDGNKAYNMEGERGIRNFEKLARAINKDYSNLNEFLADNSGCLEAMVTWIGDQNLPEWVESIESDMPEDEANED